MKELRGRLLVEGELRVGALQFDSGRIAAVELESSPAADVHELPIVAPGLIDLHIHGFGGADAEVELDKMARALALSGTTAFQPTLFPDDPKRLGRTCARIWDEAQVINGRGDCGPSGWLASRGTFCKSTRGWRLAARANCPAFARCPARPAGLRDRRWPRDSHDDARAGAGRSERADRRAHAVGNPNLARPQPRELRRGQSRRDRSRGGSNSPLQRDDRPFTTARWASPVLPSPAE